MTPYLALLGVYSQLDSVYLGMFLIALSAAGVGHLIDYFHNPKVSMVYWVAIVLAYITGIVLIGLFLSE